MGVLQLILDLAALFILIVCFDLNTDAGRFTKTYALASPDSVGPKWYYITATYDGTDTMTLYTDGTSRGTTTTSGSVTATSEAHPILIGAGSNSVVDNLASGVIDDVKWYDRDLDITEITKNFKATKSKHISTSTWSDDFSSDFI